MKHKKAIIQPFMLEKVCEALRAIDGLPGITISHVAGWGRTRNNGLDEEVIVGDGRIFVCEVIDIVRIRTGEHGHAAV